MEAVLKTLILIICVASLGAVLVSPLSEGFGTAMRTLRSKYINTTIFKSGIYDIQLPVSIYTGFHATYSKKVFTSVEGVPFAHTYGQTRWAWGSPFSDVVGDADALVMGPELGLFGVNGNKEEYPFMCYKKYEKKPINSCSGTFDDEYFLFEKTGSCYKFHEVERTWNDAFMTCSSEGGHLVIINSNDEANHVLDLLTKNIKPKKRKHGRTHDKVLRQEENYFVHVGFAQTATYEPWTIHGQTLRQAGYSKFKQEYVISKRCGMMSEKGYLMFTDCNILHYFVCEKKSGRSHCIIN